MSETLKGTGISVIRSFEPIQIVTKIDPLIELQKRTPAVGVHPLTFEMIKGILIPERRHPISEIQLCLLIDYYTTDYSFISILSPLNRMNEMALLENCIDNLRSTMTAEQQEKFPVELTPVFKLNDLGLLTDEEQTIYLRAFIPRNNSADYDPAIIRDIIIESRKKRADIALKYNSARFYKI